MGARLPIHSRGLDVRQDLARGGLQVRFTPDRSIGEQIDDGAGGLRNLQRRPPFFRNQLRCRRGQPNISPPMFSGLQSPGDIGGVSIQIPGEVEALVERGKCQQQHDRQDADVNETINEEESTAPAAPGCPPRDEPFINWAGRYPRGGRGNSARFWSAAGLGRFWGTGQSAGGPAQSKTLARRSRLDSENSPPAGEITVAEWSGLRPAILRL